MNINAIESLINFNLKKKFQLQLPGELLPISQYGTNMSAETTETECDQTCNVDFATEDDIPEIVDFLKIYFFKVIYFPNTNDLQIKKKIF